MSLNAVCSICTELFEHSEDVAAINCGHTFHNHCVSKWLESSRSCPQCRKKVGKSYIEKLFFDKPDDDATDIDTNKIKNDLSTAHMQLKEKLLEIKKLKDEISTNKTTIASHEVGAKEQKAVVIALQKQLNFFKDKVSSYDIVREELKSARNELLALSDIRAIVRGCDAEVQEIIQRQGDGADSMKNVGTYCVILKREFEAMKAERNKYRDRVHDFQKRANTKGREANNHLEKIKALKEESKKLKELLEATKTERKINSSPENFQAPGNSQGVKDTVDISDNEDDVNVITSLRKESLEPPKKKISISPDRKYSNMASSQSCAKRPRESSDSDDCVALPQGPLVFSVLKNKNGGSVLKNGYNGLGTHMNFVQRKQSIANEKKQKVLNKEKLATMTGHQKRLTKFLMNSKK